MKTIIVSLLLLLSTSHAFARIGESNVQIAQRYGAVQSREELAADKWAGNYLFKTYQVQVVFFTNICVSETITPISADKFDDDERKVLLDSIGGEGWIKEPMKHMLRITWANTTTKNSALEIDQIMTPPTLCVASPAYAAWWVEKYKTEQKAKATGF